MDQFKNIYFDIFNSKAVYTLLTPVTIFDAYLLM